MATHLDRAPTDFWAGVDYLRGQPASTRVRFLAGIGAGVVIARKAPSVLPKTGVEVQAGPATVRSIRVPPSLSGATEAEIRAMIPSDWVVRPAKTGGGSVFEDPLMKGTQIILEGPLPGAKPGTIHAGPYLRISMDGTVIRVPLDGNPVLR